jgi:hypothetical protein
MQHDELIGYARIDDEADRDVLKGWANSFLEIGVREGFTDVGPLTDGLQGLRDAVACLSVNGALIYPEVCLRELTVGDLPIMFGHIPDGTALIFFQPCAATEYRRSEEMTSIRLVVAEDEDAVV